MEDSDCPYSPPDSFPDSSGPGGVSQHTCGGPYQPCKGQSRRTFSACTGAVDRGAGATVTAGTGSQAARPVQTGGAHRRAVLALRTEEVRVAPWRQPTQDTHDSSALA